MQPGRRADYEDGQKTLAGGKSWLKFRVLKSLPVGQNGEDNDDRPPPAILSKIARFSARTPQCAGLTDVSN
jgi:hypothetical protein